MVKRKTALFKAPKPRAETPMDRTTRVVREILDEETKHREVRTARLRKARLERDAVTLAETAAETSSGTPTKPRIR